MIGALVGLIVALVAAVVVVGVVVAVLGLVLGLGVALLAISFKLLPLLLVGWVVVKLVQAAERPRGVLSGADRRWLDSSDY